MIFRYHSLSCVCPRCLRQDGWLDVLDGGSVIKIITIRGESPMREVPPRRWKLTVGHDGMHELQPADGKPYGRFTGQEWNANIWPPCPICGEIIYVDGVNVQGLQDPYPVFLMGRWSCPNDCDPRGPMIRKEA